MPRHAARLLLVVALLALVPGVGWAQEPDCNYPCQVTLAMQPCLQARLGPEFPVYPKTGSISSGLWIGGQPYDPMTERTVRPVFGVSHLGTAMYEHPDGRWLHGPVLLHEAGRLEFSYAAIAATVEEAEQHPLWAHGVACFRGVL